MTDRTEIASPPSIDEADAGREEFIRALNQMTKDQLEKFAKLVTAIQEGDRDAALRYADALGVRAAAEEALKTLDWGDAP